MCLDLLTIGALGAHIYADRATKVSYGPALIPAGGVTDGRKYQHIRQSGVLFGSAVSAFEHGALEFRRAFYAIIAVQYQVLTGYNDLPNIPFTQIAASVYPKREVQPQSIMKPRVSRR